MEFSPGAMNSLKTTLNFCTLNLPIELNDWNGWNNWNHLNS